ncbi:Uma2 family endonuclease [Spirosoma sp. KCTC 42546]|uniref:Uma2 family endonuclease n=1 Tax=Spirosoma sp. KCTC 42546 TaxID=2520506 RepID=UPI00115946BB|nr:Uma2 family endonuclease [Spirosoma sp. KCTC 42546]QDK78506.1 Uma2 family endonuclease [Spirosoma sp. KCTC 42546]
MTASQPILKTYTFDEYVALEQSEGIRYEYWDGQVIAMAGTTKRHNRIVQSLSRILYPFAQRNGCDVYTENVRQKLKTGQRYVYPDIIYTCDSADLENDMGVWVSSPSLLVEVVSNSTQSKDFHEKRPHYTKLPSLLYYLLVSQTDYRVEVFERNVDFWKYQVIEGADAIVNLPLLAITLSLKVIYEGISLASD